MWYRKRRVRATLRNLLRIFGEEGALIEVRGRHSIKLLLRRAW